MARKRKTLPDDFEALLKAGDPAAIRAVFDICEVDARDRLYKRTALAFPNCPDDLTRWLVENGADLAAEDRYGETPLHLRAGSRRGCFAGLLALGADVRHGEGQPRGTPLHRAAAALVPDNVRLLLDAGAPVDARDRDGLTPLERALWSCSNATIVRLAPVAEMLLAAGAVLGPRMAERVTRIGTEFEFHRDAFAPEHLDATSAALDRLYTLFEVPPVPRRAVHDDVSPILIPAGRWEDQFQGLWDRLVPSSGAAATVQGEVVRIAGRIAREIDANGGVNWDAGYRAMADAWLAHVGTGTPLPSGLLTEAARIIAEAKRRSGEPARLAPLAVEWVARNPRPMPLTPPAYDR